MVRAQRGVSANVLLPTIAVAALLAVTLLALFRNLPRVRR